MNSLPAPVDNTIDLQGLERLRHRAANDDPAALAEAAVQFEALFIGLMLETARSAKLGSGVFDGPQTEQYLSLMDQQVALEMAKSGGFGFGKMLLEQLAPRATEVVRDSPGAPSARSAAADRGATFPRRLPASLAALGGAPAAAKPAPDPATEETPPTADFVSRLLPEARKAAAQLGVEPRLLLAQAALETGWGQTLGEHSAANNLFGIKAGSSWQGARVARWTTEHRDGIAERKREEFRAYPSTAASFADYAELIGSAPRYARAVERASDPEAYAHEIAAAGYATDPNYAAKWLAIYRGRHLDSTASEALSTTTGAAGD